MTDERNTHIAEEDNGRTLEQIISDAEERRFARIPSEPMTPERLHAMAAARESAARRRRRKVLGGIAAVVALALMGTLIAINTLSVDVGADKNQKEEIKTEDGVIIEDGGYGAEYDDNGIWQITEWEDVETFKSLYPKIVVPKYTPKGYKFEQLIVEQAGTRNLVCKYSFIDKEQNILKIESLVQEEMLMSIDIDNISRTIECVKGVIYIQEEKTKMATIQIDDGTLVNVWCDCSDEELIRVIENL